MRGARKLRAVEAQVQRQSSPDAFAQSELLSSLVVAWITEAPEAIARVSLDGAILASNQTFARWFGECSSVSEFVPLAGTRTPGRSQSLSPRVLTLLGTHEDLAVRRLDGEVRVVECSVRKVTQEDVLLVMRDTTERTELTTQIVQIHAQLAAAYKDLERKNAAIQAMQETLIQAGKMASLGELAAGIAHEINQPLMIVRGYAQELKALIESAPKSAVTAQYQEHLKQVIENSDRMSKIIQTLRAHVRKEAEAFAEVDLHAVIDAAVGVVSSSLKNKNISVVVHRDSKLTRVWANGVLLEQVFVNLLTNARDAITSEAGRVEISTEMDQDCAVIRVADNGSGMDATVKKRVFDPFFTTKEVNQGMGLGLSLTYGIINRIQGSIVVESEPGRGSTFTLRIPKDFRNPKVNTKNKPNN